MMNGTHWMMQRRNPTNEEQIIHDEWNQGDNAKAQMIDHD
jgi:hypothetical protein